jgi:putative nucleotidyltransferase with HDIG domain
MARVDVLSKKVRELYEAKSPNRGDWADFLYKNHVFVVADNALNLSKKYNASEELSYAAGILHDIADAVTKRNDKSHEEKSLEIARMLMSESGFKTSEIELVVGDAIRFHSCLNGEKPQSLEGKILATADALAHFKISFYEFAVKSLEKEQPIEVTKNWVLRKIERDFNDKIFFDDEKKEAEPLYLEIQRQFSEI